MSAAVEPLDSQSRLDTPPEDDAFVGVVTRAVSWIIDAVLINLVAIMTGLGVALILSIFPLASNVQPAFEAVAGVAYVLWAGVYFVAFWSITGQTPGARVMQIRLVTRKRERVKPARAVIRWVGMNLAMLPLFAGYYPLLFRRRGFPDWLAKTLVLEAPQLSLAEVRRESVRRAALEEHPSHAATKPSGGDS
jgi:uncharacterized RDD family membrane protein YckC